MTSGYDNHITTDKEISVENYKRNVLLVLKIYKYMWLKNNVDKDRNFLSFPSVRVVLSVYRLYLSYLKMVYRFKFIYTFSPFLYMRSSMFISTRMMSWVLTLDPYSCSIFSLWWWEEESELYKEVTLVRRLTRLLDHKFSRHTNSMSYWELSVVTEVDYELLRLTCQVTTSIRWDHPNDSVWKVINTNLY